MTKRHANRSSLIEHHDKIIELYNMTMSCRQIREYLKLKITDRSIQRYLKSVGIVRSKEDALKLAEARRLNTIKEMWIKHKPIKKSRKGLTTNQRYKILSRDGFKCVMCGVSAKDSVLNVDHKDCNPANNSMSNLQTLCFNCNIGKNTY